MVWQCRGHSVGLFHKTVLLGVCCFVPCTAISASRVAPKTTDGVNNFKPLSSLTSTECNIFAWIMHSSLNEHDADNNCQIMHAGRFSFRQHTPRDLAQALPSKSSTTNPLPRRRPPGDGCGQRQTAAFAPQPAPGRGGKQGLGIGFRV